MMAVGEILTKGVRNVYTLTVISTFFRRQDKRIAKLTISTPHFDFQTCFENFVQCQRT